MYVLPVGCSARRCPMRVIVCVCVHECIIAVAGLGEVEMVVKMAIDGDNIYSYVSNALLGSVLPSFLCFFGVVFCVFVWFTCLAVFMFLLALCVYGCFMNSVGSRAIYLPLASTRASSSPPSSQAPTWRMRRSGLSSWRRRLRRG